eukprot:scaffold12194_cov129-Cylindrotheca_fusiformis.AAC.12
MDQTLEAARALSTLERTESPTGVSQNVKPTENNSESDSKRTDSSGSRKSKRFIPDHKKPDAALTFPEKLMNLMNDANKHDPKTYCIAWLPDGKTFIIRDPDEFTRKVLLNYFKATKFSSFTRKLYRWGFRQVNRGIGPDDPIIFGNEFFQRDNEELMKNMRSVTAASARKEEKSSLEITLAQKAQLEESDREKSRALLDQLLHQKALNSNPLLGRSNAALDMAALDMSTLAALRTNMGGAAYGLNMYDILGQRMQRSALLGPLPMGQSSILSALSGNQSYQRHASTADILNAAMGALRYAP